MMRSGVQTETELHSDPSGRLGSADVETSTIAGGCSGQLVPIPGWFHQVDRVARMFYPCSSALMSKKLCQPIAQPQMLMNGNTLLLVDYRFCQLLSDRSENFEDSMGGGVGRRRWVLMTLMVEFCQNYQSVV